MPDDLGQPGDATPTDPTSDPTGTVDITSLVAKLQATWITWANNTVKAAANLSPWTAWINAPVIRVFTSFLINLATTALANALEMQGFFFNTAIRKASQAEDYVEAVNAKDALPENATAAQIQAAEQAEMLNFRNLVMVTN